MREKWVLKTRRPQTVIKGRTKVIDRQEGGGFTYLGKKKNPSFVGLYGQGEGKTI